MEAKQIWEEALQAAQAASLAAKPTPMTVGNAKSIFGNEIDYSKPVYHVSEGMCGFAWVKIRPARGKFVKFLKDNRIGRSNDYSGGYDIWMGNEESGMTQSIERKEAAAGAMAEIFTSHGIKCYVESRLD